MKRILVIDDDILTLDVLKRILESEGYEVTTAMDGQEGIDTFRKSQIDLVITDLVMPVKDGLRTIMELKQQREDLPIIAISGGGAIPKERYLAAAQYLGNVTTLAKPFTKKRIIDVIKKITPSDEKPDALEI